jgi:hypothetical protein
MRGSRWSPLTATSLREVSDYERHDPLCVRAEADLNHLLAFSGRFSSVSICRIETSQVTGVNAFPRAGERYVT